jgi:putative lipoic acid-binding regulatory protein
MEISQYTVQILKASEGKYLTQVAETLQEHESRLYVEQITVDATTKDNYREATAAEKESYEKSLNPQTT